MVGGARNRISMGWRFGEHPAPELPFADVKKQSRGGDQGGLHRPGFTPLASRPYGKGRNASDQVNGHVSTTLTLRCSTSKRSLVQSQYAPPESKRGDNEGPVNLSAEEIKRLLSLQPHPTCGFVAETYRSSMQNPVDGLPSSYESERPWGSALYFLVTPDAQIALHRIRSDQLYHHYFGDPLDVLMLFPDGTDALVTIGDDLQAGQRSQLLIPGGHFPHIPSARDCRLRAPGQHRMAGCRAGRCGAWQCRGLERVLPPCGAAAPGVRGITQPAVIVFLAGAQVWAGTAKMGVSRESLPTGAV